MNVCMYDLEQRGTNKIVLPTGQAGVLPSTTNAPTGVRPEGVRKHPGCTWWVHSVAVLVNRPWCPGSVLDKVQRTLHASKF